MKVSISNIAWNRAEDDAVANVLRRHGIHGVDVAPSKAFPDPLRATTDDAVTYRMWWERVGCRIVGAQSLHFGHPDLTIFTSASSREHLLDFTARMIALVSTLGVTAIVFGSPKNRVRGALPLSDAMDIAVPFFQRLGTIAHAHGTCLCIEPNATAYGCDFVTTTVEGIALVQRVNHPGFRLHLDLGTMTLMDENIADAIASAARWMAHFHVSEPHLAPVGDDPRTHARHATAAAALRAQGYDRWVSIEMRESAPTQNIDAIVRALTFVTSTYA